MGVYLHVCDAAERAVRMLRESIRNHFKVYFDLRGGRDLLKAFVTLAHSFQRSPIKTHDDVMNK